VRPGHFSQTHDRPELTGATLPGALVAGDPDRAGMPLAGAMKALARYELAAQAEQRFETLSGGQQARFLILLLELSGATLLLLDEPTDNLDLASAEALEQALAAFEGTVLAVTHDRWFTRGFDRWTAYRDANDGHRQFTGDRLSLAALLPARRQRGVPTHRSPGFAARGHRRGRSSGTPAAAR
jgi:ATPase subunit of ABC transporter with duplicated ATPase domains